jgi:hypothetical protein
MSTSKVDETSRTAYRGTVRRERSLGEFECYNSQVHLRRSDIDAMQVVCAWCDRVIVEAPEELGVSHGICEKCVEEVFPEAGDENPDARNPRPVGPTRGSQSISPKGETSISRSR